MYPREYNQKINERVDMFKSLKLKQLAFLGLCLIVLFAITFQNYKYAQIERINEISSTSYVNNEQVSPQNLFLETWLLVKQSYCEPHLNNQNWSRWKRRYINKIEDNEDAYVAINTMLASLDDPYSRLLSKEEFLDQNNSIESKMYGIGVNIASVSGKIYIVNVIKGSPADINGLKQGDMIMSVNNHQIKGESIFQVAQYIKGAVNETVTLVILRNAQKLTKKIKRAEIKVKTVEYQKLDKNTGYIHILSFIGNDTPTEFINALENVKDSKGLILDLRGNTGGLFQNAVFVSNLFLSSGDIVSVIGRDGSSSSYRVQESDFVYQKPLVVLVDGDSASASEIVSGALKDNNRAKIIGTKTFGKGVVQKIYALPNQMGMNLTIARYLTPKGYDINKKGIAPDYEVTFTKDDMIKSFDRQLEFAKNVLAKEIK